MTRKATTRTETESVSWTREALQLVYRDHGGAVYAAARGFCDSGVAGDVTVEVFLRLWRHPEQHDSPQASLRTWLLTMTHDISADTRRSKATRKSDTYARPAADLDDTDQFTSAVDGRCLPAQALEILSRDERDAVVTAYYGGCSYQATAAALGLDEGTVKRRIRAGLHHLRVALART